MRRFLAAWIGLVLTAALSEAAAQDPAPGPSRLAGSAWRLVEIQSMDDAVGTSRPDDPSAYTMTLRADGTADFRLNCNRGSTTWTATPASGESGQLAFGAVATTRASCPPPSLDVELARALEHVRSYLFRDARLHLSLMADGGIYSWEPLQAAASPSFDCAAAESSAEKAVCGDPRLARLDRETARLYRLAVASPHLGDPRRKELRAMQRGWIKGRDDCWKSLTGLGPCVAGSYAFRIHELRTGYAHARSDDASGISRGPLAYACEGLGALVSAVFVQVEPPLVSLRWRDTWQALDLASPGSAYTSHADGDGRYTFRVDGERAVLGRPGGPDLPCSIEPTG